ncbi:MAG: hypothetical protein GY809_04995 [Planctomycetes bacterium]|nr:hypothetical protein [Planctomycetota bacterium]
MRLSIMACLGITGVPGLCVWLSTEDTVPGVTYDSIIDLHLDGGIVTSV